MALVNHDGGCYSPSPTRLTSSFVKELFFLSLTHSFKNQLLDAYNMGGFALTLQAAVYKTDQLLIHMEHKF